MIGPDLMFGGLFALTAIGDRLVKRPEEVPLVVPGWTRAMCRAEGRDRWQWDFDADLRGDGGWSE